ncbi:MAG: hypothetical protein ABFC80_08835 [Coriobacteriales bacterium]
MTKKENRTAAIARELGGKSGEELAGALSKAIASGEAPLLCDALTTLPDEKREEAIEPLLHHLCGREHSRGSNLAQRQGIAQALSACHSGPPSALVSSLVRKCFDRERYDGIWRGKPSGKKQSTVWGTQSSMMVSRGGAR